jgi:ribonuclease Y
MREEMAEAQESLTEAHEEMTAARRAVDEMHAEVETAEQARQAITIDTADLLARAEAQATSLLERANRDAEAIRQDALRWEDGLREEGRREGSRGERPAHYEHDESASELLDRIERLERKVAKQRRRLDRMAEAPSPADADTRSAVRRDREQFRTELEGLLRRLAPLVDETEDDEDDAE